MRKPKLRKNKLHKEDHKIKKKCKKNKLIITWIAKTLKQNMERGK